MCGRSREIILRRILPFWGGLFILSLVLMVLGYRPPLIPLLIAFLFPLLYLLPRGKDKKIFLLDFFMVNLLVYIGGGIKGFLLWLYPVFIFRWTRERGDVYGTLFGFLSALSVIILGLLDITSISPYLLLFGEELAPGDLVYPFIISLGMITVTTGLVRLLSSRLINRRVRERVGRLQSGYLDVIKILSKAIEAKDPYTKGHSERVSELARRIALEMGFSERFASLLKDAGLIHDIGKIAIRDSILTKKGPLSSDEWEEIKKHPVEGANIIRPADFLLDLIPIIEQHHERWDGKGYPYGLKGEDIHIGARILAVADAFDALTSDRPYRKRFPPDEAIRILEEGAGIQWDPEVVKALLRVLEKNPEIIAQIEERASLNI